MIYLSKNNQTEIVTDNVINFIPKILEVYLDDIVIGNFENLSMSLNYIRFICPKLELEEREYIMRIYNHGALAKEELVIVKDLSKNKINSIENNNKIKMYEK